MAKFNTSDALQFIRTLAEQNNIKIRNEWRAYQTGRAYPNVRLISIPYPSNPYNFLIAMHEIKHILDGKKFKYSFEDEFSADLFALNIGLLFDYDVNEWVKSMRSNVLSHIAKYTNKGMKINEIPEYIQMFFGDVDFINWEEYKIKILYTYESHKDVLIIKREKYVHSRNSSRKITN